MKAFLTRIVAIAILIGAILPVHAEKPYDTPEIRQALEELRGAVNKEKADGAPLPGASLSASLIARMEGVVELDEANSESMNYMLSEGFQSGVPAPVQAALQKVRAAIVARTTALDAEHQARIEALIKEAGQAVMDAKKITDLDKVISELNAAQFDKQRGRTTSQQNITQRVQSVFWFVCRWQEIIGFENSERYAEASSLLNQFSSNARTDLVLIVPRSFILTRAAEDSERAKLAQASKEKPGRQNAEETPAPEPDSQELVRRTIEKARTVDAIPQAVKELRAFRQSGTISDRNAARYLCDNAINNLQGMYDEWIRFKEGLGSGILEQISGQTRRVVSQSWAGGREIDAAQHLEFSRHINLDIARRVLPVLLREEKDPPKEEESPVGYLQRKYDEGMAAQDWEKALRVAEILNRMQPRSIENETALKSLVAARRLDAAGFWIAAVCEYEKTTRAGKEPFPTKMIDDRLAEIRKEHPAEFAAGAERALLPPYSTYSNPMANPAHYRGAVQQPPAPASAVPSGAPAGSRAAPNPVPSPEK
jgi:hypothetical protein